MRLERQGAKGTPMARRHARIEIAPITQWITAAAVQHGDELPAHLMQRLGISRRRAGHVLRKLVAAQWLASEGTPRHPRHRPGSLRQVVRRYAVEGLEEDLPWRCDFAPFFVLAPAVERVARHAFTELLNNAIDHSGGTSVTVSMRQTPLQLQLLVSDDGCGLFRRIAERHAIADPTLAMLELSKGRFTTNPERHRGHGLFFTSRLADVFDLHANASAFQCRSWQPGRWHAGRPAARVGTSVYAAFNLEQPRSLDELLRAHSRDGDGYRFECTRVSLQLLAAAAGNSRALVSRAEARRVTARLAQFRRAELDFAGIDEVGEGFADELWRVFPGAHPELELVPLGMAPQVEAMRRSVLPP